MDGLANNLSSTMTTPNVTTTMFPTTITTWNPTNMTNVTTGPPAETTSLTMGFIWAGIAVVCFGSNFVPIKKFETGDGMFFQWVMTTGIWIVGLVVYAIQGFPPFYPLAMLGGVFWATGNICVVPILKSLGLSLGMLIWGTFNLMCGWASGRFGWFGLEAEVPNNIALNYAGVGLAAFSAFIFLFVKPTLNDTKDDTSHTQPPGLPVDNEASRLITIYGSVNTDLSTSTLKPYSLEGEVSRFDSIGPTTKRIIGFLLSAVSGCLYGFSFAPVIYVQENYEGASKNGLDYVFNHFCGIYATAVFYFLVYCMVKKNQPDVYPRAILPGIASGVMWAVAQTGWFVANAALSEPVSFPIITTGPCLVAALWGVLVFKEIQGCKNLLIMCLAFSVTIGGTVLAALSKI
ncbi:transmembrane protein 144-like [Lineus longissimus]|uniref:transmembrane protein 144-like n=1 Tax=Lineus longissimus TaxID=88925 RepID=UPI002B4EFC74